MEEENAAFLLDEESNQLTLQETVTIMINERLEDAVQIIKAWLLEIDIDPDNEADTITEKKEYPDYTGQQKTAILLVTIGSEISSEIFKYLQEDEIDSLTFEIARFEAIEPDQKDVVLQEFHKLMTANRFVSTGGIDFVREVLEKSFGSQKAIDIINRLTSSLQIRPFEFIRRTDPAHIFNIIQAEHPQTIAVVMTHLPSNSASVIMESLPHNIQSEVARRIAIMDKPGPEVMREIERVLEKKLSLLSDEYYNAAGIDNIAEILNLVDRASERKIIETIEDKDPELAKEIKKRMFVFENIVILDDRSIQRVMREVDPQEWTKALKGEDTGIQNMIFKNMSRRAADILKEDIDDSGSLRLKDVEESQKNIVSIIRRLEDAGEIVIDHTGENELVAGKPIKSKSRWDYILPKLSSTEKDLLIKKVEYKTLVTAFKLTRRDVFEKYIKTMKFFERLKLKRDICRLKDVGVDDVVEAQNEIMTIVRELVSSESTEKLTDETENRND
jgi:flagellar motor switch protein FliG